jgi:hypothetical protein
MAKTVFNYNTPVSAEWFNIINGTRLRFDGDPTNPSGMVDGQYLPIRDVDITSGNSTLSNVLANDLVKTTGNQTIAGIKTFTSPIQTPTAIDPTDAINLSQLNSRLLALENIINNQVNSLDGGNVKTAGNQIINGAKQFTSPVRVGNAVQVSDAVTLAQLTSAINSAGSTQYGGNYITYPNGLKFSWGTIYVTGANWTVGGNFISDQHGLDVYFPQQFTNKPSVTLTVTNTIRTGDWGAGVNVNIFNLTNQHFSWYGDSISGSYIADGEICWMAIGY